MTADDDEIKQLLGRALAGEPPLRLDRDEIVRRGRRRLRNRRRLEAGGAVTGVVAAVVGAVLLSGLVGGDEPDRDLPPAATGTVTSAPRSATTDKPRQLPPAPVSTVADSPVATAQADVLTQAFRQADLVPDSMRLRTSDGQLPHFLALGPDHYELITDVRASDREGGLLVRVESATRGAAASCETMVEPEGDCEVRDWKGVDVVVAAYRDASGEKRHTVVAIHPDGTAVTAIATNLSNTRRVLGRPPAGHPILDDDTLIGIAVEPTLRLVG